MKTRDELIAMGKEWLEHAPPAGSIAPGLRSWSGEGLIVCAECASRILGRGCNLRELAPAPVWADDVRLLSGPHCDLCERKVTA